MTVRPYATAVVWFMLLLIQSAAFVLPTPISTVSLFPRDLSLLSFMAATHLDAKVEDIYGTIGNSALERDSGSWAVSCNRRPDLPGDAEKRRIDDDADGNRDGRAYEQAHVS